MKCLLAVKVQMLVNQPLQIMHLLESCNLCLLTNGAFRSLKSILSFLSIHSCLFVLPRYSFFTNAVFIYLFIYIYFFKFSLQFFHGLFTYALLETQMKFLVIFDRCLYILERIDSYIFDSFNALYISFVLFWYCLKLSQLNWMVYICANYSLRLMNNFGLTKLWEYFS